MVKTYCKWYNGKILQVIKNLYANAKSCVRSEGNISDMFPTSRGVRQGENLSPLLFAIYVNDLKHHMAMYYDGLPTVKEHFVNKLNNSDMWKDLFVLLYADDTIILAESEDQLQKSLNGLHYCKKWYLKVNIKKTNDVLKGCYQKKAQTCL